MFEGKGRSEYEQKHFIKKEKLAQIAQRKAFDKAHLDTTKLRRNRIDMLAALTAQQDPALPMIADGFVREEPTARGIAAAPSTATLHTVTTDTHTATSTSTSTSTSNIKLGEARSCYVCKARYNTLHTFYHSLCPPCASLNWEKRQQTCNLVGRVALVTGARVKIGFCVALKLLRWGATVVVTTRFPTDCAKRYAGETDYNEWRSRLHIYGLDFRDLRRVEHFCNHFEQTHRRIDIVINNACQTIRRPTAYYAPLLQYETAQEGLHESVRDVLGCNRRFVAGSVGGGGDESLLLDSTSGREANSGSSGSSGDLSTNGTTPSVLQSQLNVHPEDGNASVQQLPTGATDVNGQQLDLRKRNTWIMKMEEIQTAELAEVFAINSIAPFIINSRLTPLLKRSLTPAVGGESKAEAAAAAAAAPCRKFIVNVSAMEGKFYRNKTPNHPHTNMAKAALNMMTRTSGADLSTFNIFMTAVDTGWINDENPLEKAVKIAEEHNFQTPLDEVDAAARILDPVCCGLNDCSTVPAFGIFIKDYFETEW